MGEVLNLVDVNSGINPQEEIVISDGMKWYNLAIQLLGKCTDENSILSQGTYIIDLLTMAAEKEIVDAAMQGMIVLDLFVRIREKNMSRLNVFWVAEKYEFFNLILDESNYLLFDRLDIIERVGQCNANITRYLQKYCDM